jgi:hypothetical protein
VKHDKESSTILNVSHKIYERSLFLYCTDVRGEFGGEMIEVFDEQLAEAYARRGITGLLRVWFSATQDLVTVALPGRLAAHGIPILAVTATLAFMLWFAGYINNVMQTACSGCGH